MKRRCPECGKVAVIDRIMRWENGHVVSMRPFCKACGNYVVEKKE